MVHGYVIFTWQYKWYKCRDSRRLFCVLQSCGLQPQRSSRRVILPFFFSFYAKTCESTRARTYNYINTLPIKCVQFWIENML